MQIYRLEIRRIDWRSINVVLNFCFIFEIIKYISKYTNLLFVRLQASAAARRICRDCYLVREYAQMQCSENSGDSKNEFLEILTKNKRYANPIWRKVNSIFHIVSLYFVH